MSLANSNEFNAILNDRVHGSTDLVIKFLKLIIKTKPSRLNVFDACNIIASAFVEMNIIQSVVHKLKENDPIAKAIEILEGLEMCSDLIAKRLSKLIHSDDVIAVFSNSKTIQDVITYLKPKLLVVFISDPGGEGKVFANSVNLRCQLVKDEYGLELITKNKINVILIGCDMYMPNYGIINKVGTKNLVKQALLFNTPVYVLTSSLKFAEQLPEIKSSLLELIEITENMQIITESGYL